MNGLDRDMEMPQPPDEPKGEATLAAPSCSVRSWPRWRIVTDNYDGYEVQIQETWWQSIWDAWIQCQGVDGDRTNSFATLEAARVYAASRPPSRPPYQPFESRVVENCKH